MAVDLATLAPTTTKHDNNNNNKHNNNEHNKKNNARRGGGGEQGGRGGIGAEDEFESVRAARKTRVDHVRHADGVPSKALRSGNVEGHPLPPRLQKQERHESKRCKRFNCDYALTCWNWCVAPGRRKMAVAATAIGAMEKASAKLCLSVGLISSNR